MTDGQHIDPLNLRRAFGTFMTGVTVVTAKSPDGAEIGMTANSFTSVSLDPPLLLVCVGERSTNYAAFMAVESFGVHVLREGQDDVASRFARRGEDRFAAVKHRPGETTGVPLLAESAAWFECVVHSRVPAGDHLILIGRVVAFDAVDVPPLGFWRGKYVVARDDFAPGARAEPTITAYLVEHAGALLLRQDPTDGWHLPTARRPRRGIAARMHDAPGLKIRPEETFIYSIYEDAPGIPGVIVYRTRLAEGEEALAPGYEGPLRWFGLNELPWDEIRSRPLKAVLKRYLRERRDGSFSIYVDSEIGGHVARIASDLSPWASLALD